MSNLKIDRHEEALSNDAAEAFIRDALYSGEGEAPEKTAQDLGTLPGKFTGKSPRQRSLANALARMRRRGEVDIADRVGSRRATYYLVAEADRVQSERESAVDVDAERAEIASLIRKLEAAALDAKPLELVNIKRKVARAVRYL